MTKVTIRGRQSGDILLIAIFPDDVAQIVRGWYESETWTTELKSLSDPEPSGGRSPESPELFGLGKLRSRLF